MPPFSSGRQFGLEELTREVAVHLRLVSVAVENGVDAAIGRSEREEKAEKEEVEESLLNSSTWKSPAITVVLRWPGATVALKDYGRGEP